MSGSRLYVGNLGYHVTTAEVRQMFAAFGAIKDAYAPPPKEGAPKHHLHRGYCFIEFENARDAVNAMEMLNQTSDPSGRVLQIREAARRHE